MPELSHVHMDPEGPVPTVGDGLMLAELPAEALDTFIDVAGAGRGHQLAAIELITSKESSGAPDPRTAPSPRSRRSTR
jgi:hypothetical protein